MRKEKKGSKAPKHPKEPKTFEIEQILRKVKWLGKVYFEIKWEGYDEITLEPYHNIKEDVPQMFKEFMDSIWAKRPKVETKANDFEYDFEKEVFDICFKSK